MRDNFTNPNPFFGNKSKLSEMLDSYTNLVNQPTAAEPYADAFTKAGSAPARGPMAHEANALLSGIGAGIQGAVNQGRQEKLSPYMQMAGQLTAKAAELEAQMQEDQQHQAQVKQFFKQNTVPIAELSKASLAGDTPATNQIAQGILRNYKQMFGDQTVGDFDHYHNGTIFYENLENGTIEGKSVASLIYQAGINPVELFGQDAAIIEAGLSAGAKLKYENTLEANRLDLEGKRAGIANQYSQANYRNTQTKVAEHEMNAPKPKYSDVVQNSLTQENHKWINSLRDEHNKLTKQANAYEEIGNLIARESSAFGFGRAGTGLISMAQRAVNFSGTESEKNQALIELYKQPLMAGIKEMFAGATSDLDVANFVAGLPSLDKNPNAAIKVAKERADEIRQRIESDNHTRDVLENEFGYSEPYNSLAVQNKVKERLGSNKPNKQETPSNDVESLKKKYFKQ